MKRTLLDDGEGRGLSVSCQKQLNSYALAAAAAGVSLLAQAQQSEAKIIYTPADHVIRDQSSYRLDFNGDKRTDLTILNKFSQHCTSDGSCRSSELLAAKMAGSNEVVYDHFGAVAIKRGALIGPKGAFQRSSEQMALLHGGSYSSQISGSWINVKNRYLGVKFYIEGKVHYGWARLSVDVQLPFAISATLTGYAYETIPNRPIIAGKTKGPDVIIVQPTSLGHLAAGASAISAWRSQK